MENVLPSYLNKMGCDALNKHAFPGPNYPAICTIPTHSCLVINSFYQFVICGNDGIELCFYNIHSPASLCYIHSYRPMLC